MPVASRGARRGAILGAIAGAVVAGAAGGLVAERRIVRGRRARAGGEVDAELPQPEGAVAAPGLDLPGSDAVPPRERIVHAADGVPLAVTELGPVDAPMCAVFVHGYTLHSGCWQYQRAQLGDLAASGDVRLVFYDQRSHGRSGRSELERCTIEQLAADLQLVLDEVAPDGKVVLVGHSMGGMAVLALAQRAPELFAPRGRVVGVALLSTSAGKLAELTFGLPAIAGRVVQRIVPHAAVGLVRTAPSVERARQAGSELTYTLTRRLAFGPHPAPDLVEFLDAMIGEAPVEVIAAFAPSFLNHDKLAALPALAGTDVLVLVGDADLLTPVEHSRAIAAALPSAQLVVLPGAGHLVILERPALVSHYLRELLARASEHPMAATA
jgi:pimeloyl-ACP methyl ester carboxylesterase